MNRNSWLRWAAVLILAVGVFVVSRSLADRAAAVRSQAAALSAKRAAAERALASLRPAPSAPTPAAPVVAAKPAPSPQSLAEAEELNQRATARRILLNSWFDRVYRPFFRQALWSPEQVAALRRAVLDHWLRWCDAIDVFQQQHLAPNDPVIRKMAREEWQRYDAEVKAAVGPEEFDQLQQFVRASPAKSVADTAAALVFDSGEPLRGDQAAKVTEVLAKASPSYGKGRAASLDDIDVPAAVAQLKAVLSPTQLAALETTLTAHQAGRKLDALLRAAVQPEPAPGEKAPATTAATTP